MFKSRFSKAVLFVLGLFIVITALVGLQTPRDFPVDTVVTIEKNTGLTHTAQMLMEKHVIGSAFLYKVAVVLMGGHKNIMAGDYVFDAPQPLFTVARRTIKGNYGLTTYKVTIPEGSTSKDIGWIILKEIPDFNAPAFLSLAKPLEGYLFPDTYLFYSNVKPQEVVKMLTDTFDEKISTLKTSIGVFVQASSKATSSRVTSEQVLTMASIVEREAMNAEDRKIISGILWKRYKAGMALQVDAPFHYLYNKPSSELTLDDLKIDSPYNTYVYKGLPPGPISNPGLETIQDTIAPKETKYWYYLSDKDGKMHYAEDLEGHVKNKQKYL